MIKHVINMIEGKEQWGIKNPWIASHCIGNGRQCVNRSSSQPALKGRNSGENQMKIKSFLSQTTH